MTTAHLEDFIVWAAAGVVLGGRIDYILFYDPIAVGAHFRAGDRPFLSS